MTLSPTTDDVRRALALTGFDHEQAWRMMAPRPRGFRRPTSRQGEPRTAGVMLLLYPTADGLTFVLTRRTEKVGSHKGQISLPGGSIEPQDDNPTDTAIRETCEELAVCEADIMLLGELTPLYVIVSDFVIHPIVACVPARPEFVPQPTEVAEVLEVSLATLLDDGIKVTEQWKRDGYVMDVPFYRVGSHAVWGATAIILSEFEARLRAVLPR